MTLDALDIHKVWLRLDEDGAFRDADALARVSAAITADIKKIVVISHGWKTDVRDAAGQYAPLWGRVLEHRPDTRKDTLLVCLNWPSKTYNPGFVDNLSQSQVNALSAKTKTSGDLSEEVLDEEVEEAAALLGIDRAALDAAVAKAVKSGAAEDLFRLVFKEVHADADAEVDEAAVPADAKASDARAAFKTMQKPPPALKTGPQAAGLKELGEKLIKGPRNAAAWVLNQATYFQMKKRAGTVGAALSKAFAGLKVPKTVDLHLIGHSFGGRLVTAFADAWTPRADLPLKSVTLLQAAFSHYGLSPEKPGVFKGAFDKVKGPFVITHTHRDSANYYAYFYASLVSGVQAAAAPQNILGGNKDSPFGAMGANGAQRSGAEAASIGFFDPKAHKIYNINADTFIGDHMDIGRSETGQMVARTIA